MAPRLLGWTLTHRTDDGPVTVRLTEVEAYEGTDDPASHACRGPTPRNALMFGPPGRLYVYFSYGMHWCANVVCGPEGTASAVLLRAGDVLDGVELARTRRGSAVLPARDLARGPARLTRALGVDGRANGADLLTGGAFSLRRGPAPDDVSAGPRVGIASAADRPWRFWVTGSNSVSPYRRSPRVVATDAPGTR